MRPRFFLFPAAAMGAGLIWAGVGASSPGVPAAVRLYDLVTPTWGLGPIYIHRADGKHAVLQPHVEGQSTPGLKGDLYDNGPPGPDAARHQELETTWTIKDVLP